MELADVFRGFNVTPSEDSEPLELNPEIFV